jgi:hypothetical protein
MTPHAEADLLDAVRELSDEAFELAKATAGGGQREMSPPDREARARELRGVLPQLGERVRAMGDEGARSQMSHLLSESNLDLRYVAAQGNLPSSVRLHAYLEGVKRGSPG